jgi:hypothetical protein
MVGVEGTAGPNDPALQVLRRKGNGSLLRMGEPQLMATPNISAQALSDDGRWLLIAGDDPEQLESLRVTGSTGVIVSKDTLSLDLQEVNAIVIANL